MIPNADLAILTMIVVVGFFALMCFAFDPTANQRRKR